MHLKSVAGTLEEEGNYNGSYKCDERENDDEGGGPSRQGFRCSLLSGTEFLEKIGLRGKWSRGRRKIMVHRTCCSVSIVSVAMTVTDKVPAASRRREGLAEEEREM